VKKKREGDPTKICGMEWGTVVARGDSGEKEEMGAELWIDWLRRDGGRLNENEGMKKNQGTNQFRGEKGRVRR